MARAQFTVATQPEPVSTRSVKFVSSGSALIDLVLGGGWAQGRVVNIVGDRSAGKTLLAIEAMINFEQAGARLSDIHYEEAESAFDEDYARLLGIPKGISRSNEETRVRTVEDLERSIDKFLGRLSGNSPAIYILDSLDALSDEAEMGRDIGEGSYGGAKAKKMSELFRKRVRAMEDSNCTFFVISQIRDKIGVTFGETKTRSGGKALDFYSSQIVWLSEIRKLPRTVKGVERIVGVDVRVRNKKNKVGPPFREADVNILFNYGVDDEESMLHWLVKNKALAGEQTDKEIRRSLVAARTARDRAEVMALRESLRMMVHERWVEIEAALMPPMSKYGKGA